MEKYTDFTNVKQLSHNQLSTYFNFPTGLQQLSETTVAPIDPVPIPRHLELIKCSLCNRTVEMYIDIHEDVFKRFYCATCISSKKLPPFPTTKCEHSDLSTNVPPKQATNSHGTNSSQTKSQATQSIFSSPSFSSSSAQPAKKCSKPKQPKHNSHCNSSMLLPYNGSECCPSSMINRCNRYGHFLDEPSCHSHHCCDRERSINKRSWSVANRRPWSTEQKDTIFSYFGLHIEARRSIGKEDILPLMELKKELFADRTWKEIKWVYYHHLKVLERRKSGLHSGSEGELAPRHPQANVPYMDEDLTECSNSPNNTTYSARTNDEPVPV